MGQYFSDFSLDPDLSMAVTEPSFQIPLISHSLTEFSKIILSGFSKAVLHSLIIIGLILSGPWNFDDFIWPIALEYFHLL